MNTELFQKQQHQLAAALNNKTIFVNGSTGLIGSRIVHYLLSLNTDKEANINILCGYRNEAKKEKLYEGIKKSELLNFLLCEDDKTPKFDGNIDYIIQAAGISGGTKMHLKDPIKVFEASYEATKSLLDFAVSHKVSKFLFVSTYEIYGSINKDIPVKEDEPCRLETFTLRNIYAECKRICESLCTAYSSKYGIETFSGRLTSTFGAGVKFNDPRFFAEFARCVIEEKDIVLKSTGGTIRSYLDADDAASAFLFILANGESCNAYNLTNMKNVICIRDIANKLIELTGNKVKLVFDIAEDSTKLGFRKEGCTLIDAHKLEALGWYPVYTFEDTLNKLLVSMKLSKDK